MWEWICSLVKVKEQGPAGTLAANRIYNMTLYRILLLLLLTLQVIIAQAQVSPADLSKAVGIRLERVPEFKFIREEAAKLGVQVYLFGGSASAFAHYVRWDLEREAGDSKYQEERFDYDFTNIYRGNQDLDIVVDGSAEQAEQLQALLQKEYPHFVGSKDAWEVRLLRKTKGDKLPLLNDFDFLNQHTDTNSTGMVALTAEGEDFVFRDLFSWETKDSRFLEDVAGAKIKFLYSDTHEETARYKDGKNPPIFAAVRYLAKLTQYEVEGDEEDLKIIAKIIKETDWKEVKSNYYVSHKLEEFGKKVLLNAPNSEYAWDLLDSLGLRTELIKMDGNQIGVPETLSWWMSKEPLRSQDLGAKGETAESLFGKKEIILTHETNSFAAYENITRSSKGLANAFISRDNMAGEAAVFGNGFYTKIGREGAAGTGLSIRFKLNPKAREGEDFIVAAEDFIVVRNKNALTLIQENLNLNLIDYLKLLASGEIGSTDKGLREKFNRKFKRASMSSDEFKKAIQFAKRSVFISEDLPEEYSFENVENFEITDFDSLVEFYTEKRKYYFIEIIEKIAQIEKISTKEMAWIKHLIKHGDIDAVIVQELLMQPRWIDHPDLIETLIDQGRADGAIVEHILSSKGWEKPPHLVKKILDRNTVDSFIVEHILSKEHWSENPAWLEVLIERNQLNGSLAQHVFSKEFWAGHADLLGRLIEKGGNDFIAEHVLSKEFWAGRTDLLFKLFENSSDDINIIRFVLSKDYWTVSEEEFRHIFDRVKTNITVLDSFIELVLRQEQYSKYPYIVDELMAMDNRLIQKSLIEHVFSKEFWAKSENAEIWINKLLKNPTLHGEIAKHILSLPRWEGRDDWLSLVLKSQGAVNEVVQHVFSQAHWKDQADKWLDENIGTPSGLTFGVIEWILSKEHMKDRNDLMERIIRNEGRNVHTTLTRALKKEHWASYPELIHQLIDRGTADSAIASAVLSQEHWAVHPKLLERLIDEKGNEVHLAIVEDVLSKPFWSNHPEFVEKLISKVRKTGNKSKLADALINNVLSKEHWAGHPQLTLKLFDKVNAETQRSIILHTLGHESWIQHPELFFELIDKIEVQAHLVSLAIAVLRRDAWYKHPKLLDKFLDKLIDKGDVTNTIVANISYEQYGNTEWVKKLISKNNQAISETVAAHVLSREPWQNHPELAEMLIAQCKATGNSCHHSEYFLKEARWTQHPYLVEQLIELDQANHIVAFGILKTAEHWGPNQANHWGNFPDLLIKVVNRGIVEDERLNKELLTAEAWGQNEELRSYLNGRPLNAKSIRTRSKEIPFEDWQSKNKTKGKDLQCHQLLAG